MLQIILLTLILANLFVSILNKKSKILIIISTILISIIFAGSRDMADWENYYSDYLRGDGNYNRNGQIGYYFIVKFFKFLGLSFNGYRIIISLICLSIINKFIFKYSPIPNLVYVAYLSYLIFLDDVQIRNFIACSILYIGFLTIIQHHNRWRAKYFIIVIIASIVHNSFWIYLLFLTLPDNISNDTLVKRIGIIGLIMTIIAIYIRPFISNIVLLLSFIAKKAEYYSEIETGYGGVIYVLTQLLAIFCIYYTLHTNVKSSKGALQKYDKSFIFLKTVILMDILSLVFLPTIILSLTFNRLVRNLFIINIIAFTLGIKKNQTRLICSTVFIIYIALFVYVDLVGGMAQRIILDPFFNNNIYFY